MTLRATDFLIDDETMQRPAVIDTVMLPTIDGEQKGKGLIPRDYRTDPIEMFDPPSEIKLYSDSELSALIKEKEERKSCLSHNRESHGDWPALDQNGQGYSHTEDTEVLTEKGWVRWPDWNRKDLLATVNLNTHAMEFQAATESHAYEYKDEMYYSTNRRLDFGVTRNHRMIVRKWNERLRTLSPFYSEQRADELGWYVGMMAAPSGWQGVGVDRLNIEGDRDYAGDDFVALVSLICSDGYASDSQNCAGLVSFCCFRSDRREKVAALAHRVGFREQPSRQGVWHRYGAHALSAWVKANCYVGLTYRSPFKRVPEIIKSLSMRQITHFLDFFGDKNHGEDADPVFYSSSKRMIDDLQELHLRIGKRSTITAKAPRSTTYEKTGQVISSGPSYVLNVSGTERLCLDRKKHIETDRYKGLVYCATVPNGTLVTRRNGSVLISGNCWYYSTTSAVMICRARDNQPYVRLSAHAGACIIKNYRNEGGWCGLSAKRQISHGTPSVEFWPEKSMSRANDKPETWANAAMHKVTENWIDLTRDVYDQNLTLRMVLSLLVANQPCAVDYNHWGHSVCAIDAVEVEPGSFGVRILNSWANGWGDRGMGVLRGSKAVPNGAVCMRVSGASTT